MDMAEVKAQEGKDKTEKWLKENYYNLKKC